MYAYFIGLHFMILKYTLFLFCCFNLLACNSPLSSSPSAAAKRPSLDINDTRAKAKQALAYCKSNNFNDQFCILIDMRLHSGVNRFVVWDFKQDTITYKCLVGHGCCKEAWSNHNSKDNPMFSNVDGSHCSSLGKYKIGERAYSDWGVHIKYVLHGLEASNSNALKRFIVFHSWDVVADEEIFPNGTPEGWGCPTISNKSFKHIDPLLKTSGKPVLMWIFND
jgi:hypothetical protein